MSNGSNLDPTPPDNSGTGLPGGNVDDAREQVAERVQRKLDERRIPSSPVAPGGNK